MLDKHIAAGAAASRWTSRCNWPKADRPARRRRSCRRSRDPPAISAQVPLARRVATCCSSSSPSCSPASAGRHRSAVAAVIGSAAGTRRSRPMPSAPCTTCARLAALPHARSRRTSASCWSVYTRTRCAAPAKRSPLDRTTLADALTNLDAMGAKAIGIDILFDQAQPEDRAADRRAEGDEDAGVDGLCHQRRQPRRHRGVAAGVHGPLASPRLAGTPTSARPRSGSRPIPTM